MDNFSYFVSLAAIIKLEISLNNSYYCIAIVVKYIVSVSYDYY